MPDFQIFTSVTNVFLLWTTFESGAFFVILNTVLVGFLICQPNIFFRLISTRYSQLSEEMRCFSPVSEFVSFSFEQTPLIPNTFFVSLSKVMNWKVSSWQPTPFCLV